MWMWSRTRNRPVWVDRSARGALDGFIPSLAYMNASGELNFAPPVLACAWGKMSPRPARETYTATNTRWWWYANEASGWLICAMPRPDVAALTAICRHAGVGTAAAPRQWQGFAELAMSLYADGKCAPWLIPVEELSGATDPIWAVNIGGVALRVGAKPTSLRWGVFERSIMKALERDATAQVREFDVDTLQVFERDTVAENEARPLSEIRTMCGADRLREAAKRLRGTK